MFISANRLKELRHKKGVEEGRKITQAVFAEEIDKPRATIAGWESEGSGVKKYEDVLIVCKYFNIELPDEDQDINKEPLSAIERLTKAAGDVFTDMFSNKNIEDITTEHTEAADEFRKSLERLQKVLKKKNDTKK